MKKASYPICPKVWLLLRLVILLEIMIGVNIGLAIVSHT